MDFAIVKPGPQTLGPKTPKAYLKQVPIRSKTQLYPLLVCQKITVGQREEEHGVAHHVQ